MTLSRRDVFIFYRRALATATGKGKKKKKEKERGKTIFFNLLLFFATDAINEEGGRKKKNKGRKDNSFNSTRNLISQARCTRDGEGKEEKREKNITLLF